MSQDITSFRDRSSRLLISVHLWILSLQRDITGLLRELIKHEDSTRWQFKHRQSVKNAIRIGFTELDTTYMTLSVRPLSLQTRSLSRVLTLSSSSQLATQMRPSVPSIHMSPRQGSFLGRDESFLGRTKSMSIGGEGGGRNHVDRSLRSAASSSSGARSSYYTHSRTHTVSSFDD